MREHLLSLSFRQSMKVTTRDPDLENDTWNRTKYKTYIFKIRAMPTGISILIHVCKTHSKIVWIRSELNSHSYYERDLAYQYIDFRAA